MPIAFVTVLQLDLYGEYPNLSFGQLQPGVYHLEVKTTNGDKVWGTNVYQLTVKVGYPWWLKTPACLFML